jgi:uncharacterized Zn-binding protein involved in type VI secretion
MPAAARSSGQDDVFSKTGTGKFCSRPVQTVTNEGSENVLINGFGVVRQGDSVGSHAAGGCGPDLSVLTSFSSTVFINGKGVGRIGDEYTPDNIIISGSTNVFIGG